MNHFFAYIYSKGRDFTLCMALLAIGSVLHGQELGFLTIDVDSAGIPVFIDGIYIQETPIDGVIPLITGFHEASLVPDEMNTPLLKSRLTEATQEFFIKEGDTVRIHLRSVDSEDQIQALRGESILSQYVGWFMIGIVLYLTVALTG